jgi:hypothetical protein
VASKGNGWCPEWTGNACNPSQWYVLAEANGLSGTEELKAGQVLVVPSNGKLELINSQTHKTYNENEIVGSKLPNLKSPPPKGKKCGGFLQILVIIVAIVVTIYTAGAAAGLMGASITTAAGTTVAAGTMSAFSAGLAVLGGAGGMIGMGAAMIGGAIGSIVSQGVGIAVGVQEHFSWKSVAMSAIGSGVAAGIGGTGVFNLTPSTAINTGLTGHGIECGDAGHQHRLRPAEELQLALGGGVRRCGGCQLGGRRPAEER